MKCLKWQQDSSCFVLRAEELCLQILKEPDLHTASLPVGVGQRSRDFPQGIPGGPGQMEVPACVCISLEGYDFRIEGTIPYLEEAAAAGSPLKLAYFLTPGESSRMRKAELCHAKILAYLAAETFQTDMAEVLCYETRREGEITAVRTAFSSDKLVSFVRLLLESLLPDARLSRKRALEEIPTLAHAIFPFREVRQGQRELILEVRDAIEGHRHLFAQAPTGSGKTISTLYASLTKIGQGRAEQVFYLTAKSATRAEAEKALSGLVRAGASLHAVTLSALHECCIREGGYDSFECRRNRCRFARGFGLRLPEALCEMMEENRILSAGVIRKYAEKHTVCPYALAQETAVFCEVVIGDYNHFFDPAVYLRRFFRQNQGKELPYVLLVDEAHNLPDRIRDTYSRGLSLSGLKALMSPEHSLPEPIVRSCRAAVEKLERIGAGMRKDAMPDPQGKPVAQDLQTGIPEWPGEVLAPLHAEFRKALRRFASDPEQTRKLETLGEPVSDFMRIYEPARAGTEESRGAFVFYTALYGEELTFEVRCLDPSVPLLPRLRLIRSAVFFSATLTPPSYFADQLCRMERCLTASVSSPFEKERLCVAVVDSLSTRQEDRRASVPALLRYLGATFSSKAGNYLVYFPSYAYLKEAYGAFTARYPKVRTMCQEPGMKRDAQAAFRDFFKEDSGVLRVGFCVLGGAFSEGMDLPGNRLIGVVVVGTGLPGLSTERNILRSYYDEHNGMGYPYAYVYPGMNAVLQAAGRVIRTETDRGVVVLLDDRYSRPDLRALFPEYWKTPYFTGDPYSLKEILERFWQQKNPDQPVDTGP
ncbi:MAG: ATP-dependent DNA helicase [Clostridia bacterium]|nr:ATP-dependent DNA helicase [Clostridia bacterium]